MTIRSRIAVLAAAGTALLLSACGTGSTSPSGFLRDFSQLGGGYDTAGAVAGYIDPTVDFSNYDSVIVEPVTTIVAAQDVPAAVVEQLAAYLGDSLRAEIGKDLKLVGTPGPTTIRMRFALTDVVAGLQGTATTTTVHANPRARLSGPLGSQAVTEFVSDVSFEAEALDSVTGKRLLASTDQRLGAKREAAPSTDWVAVRRMVDEGAGRVRRRLEAVRQS